jgi:hypothetical protein
MDEELAELDTLIGLQQERVSLIEKRRLLVAEKEGQIRHERSASTASSHRSTLLGERSASTASHRPTRAEDLSQAQDNRSTELKSLTSSPELGSRAVSEDDPACRGLASDFDYTPLDDGEEDEHKFNTEPSNLLGMRRRSGLASVLQRVTTLKTVLFKLPADIKLQKARRDAPPGEDSEVVGSAEALRWGKLNAELSNQRTFYAWQRASGACVRTAFAAAGLKYVASAGVRARHPRVCCRFCCHFCCRFCCRFAGLRCVGMSAGHAAH